MGDTREFKPDEKVCANCRWWSQWLSTTGDCMEYVMKRREALMRSLDTEAFNREWPARSAHDTQADDTCDQFEVSKEGQRI